MNITYEDIREAASQLPVKERIRLAHVLLKDIDEGDDENVEALWIEEAKRRYEAYKRGEMEAYPVEDVVARVLDRIRR